MAHRNTTTTGNAQLVSSLAVNVPAGAAVDDIVVVLLYRWESINPAVTAPSGFVHLGTQQVSTATPGTKLDYYYKVLTAADTGTYSFSWTGTMWTSISASAFSGCTGTPTVVNANSGSTGTPFTMSGTLAATSDLLWGLGCDSAATRTPPTSPSAFTEQVDNDSISTATLNAVAAGSVSVSGATQTVTDWTGVSLVALQNGTAATNIDPAPFNWNPPGLFRGPRSMPQPWFGTGEPGTAAAQSTAETGSATVAGATTATEVKVAKVTGACTVGFAPGALEKKAAPQAGAVTVGTAGTAQEKKSAPGAGIVTIGAGGTGVESTALTTATRPAISVVTAPRIPAYARSQPALILNGFVRGQSPPAAEQGSATVGTAATATPVKLAKVAGTCTVGTIGVGTAKKVAVSVGAEPVGTVITGAEKKVAPESGAATVGDVGTGTAKKVAPEQGVGGVGFAATRSGLAVRAQTGVAAVGTWAGSQETATITARRSPAVTVLTAQPSATWRVTSTPLVLAAPTEISPPAAQGGTATFGAPNTAVARKVAAVTGTCGVGTSGTGAEKKVAAGRGTVVVGLSGTRSGVLTRPVAGICTLGTGARGTEAKTAAPAGVAALGTSGRGTLAKTVGSSGRVTLGLFGSGAAARRIAMTGRTCVGLTGSVATIFTLDFHPRAGVVVDTADRRLAGTVVDTADRDSAGVTADTADRRRSGLPVAGPRIRAGTAVDLAERF